MEIKTICKLTLKQEDGYLSYTDYEVYPVASLFAETDKDAIVKYIQSNDNLHVEITGCDIMEASILGVETITFYRIHSVCDLHPTETDTSDYIIISNRFITS